MYPIKTQTMYFIQKSIFPGDAKKYPGKNRAHVAQVTYNVIPMYLDSL